MILWAMLFYETISQMPDKLRHECLEFPHYVVTETQLKEAGGRANITTKAAFEQLSLPHICFVISLAPVKRETESGLIESYLIVLEDQAGEVRFTFCARFEWTTMTPYVRGRWSLSKGGVEIENHNMPDKGDKARTEAAVDELVKLAMDTIVSFDMLLRNRETREAKERRTVKTEKAAKGKKAYRDVTIIHLASRSDIESGAPGVRRDIAWSHSWTVRGHWRAFDGIGKNRAGERTEMGRTWVIPFEKQTQLELKNKVRVIK